MSKSRCLSLLDTKVNPDCLLFSEREREREREGVSLKFSREGGGGVVRWCWVNFQCRGVLLIWIIVGQGPIALAGASGVCLNNFSLVYLLFFFSLPFWETGRYRLKYCQKGPLHPKQPTNQIQSSLVYSCYLVYSKVSDKNACRSRDSDLTTHSAIPNSISRRFVVV